MGSPRHQADVALFEAGSATLPVEAWAPLFAHSFGVRAGDVSAVLSGARDTRLFDVNTACQLVAVVGERWGRAAGERAAGDDPRVRVMQRVTALPRFGSESLTIGSVGELATVAFTTDPSSGISQRRAWLPVSDFAEVVFTAAAFTSGGFDAKVTAALATLSALETCYGEPGSRRQAPAVVALAAAKVWAHSEGVDPASASEAADVAPLDAATAVAVFAAALSRVSRWWALGELPAGLLSAASEASADGSGSGRAVDTAVAAGIAVQIFQETGSIPETLAPFGPSANTSDGSVVDALFREWFSAARSLYISANRAAETRAAETRAAGSESRRTVRPLDPFLLECTNGGATVLEVSHECFAATSPEFTPWQASAFWHSTAGFARDVVKEFAHMCSGRFGHRWDPVEVLDVVECRGEAFSKMFADVLPSVTADLASSGYTMPAELVEFSMRAKGLHVWATLTPASVVTDLETVAAAENLSAAGWSTVWELLPEFAGTPGELVGVAALTSPDS